MSCGCRATIVQSRGLGPIARRAGWPPLRRIGAITLGTVLVALASPAWAGKRIELYDAQGQHAGYAIVKRRQGRVDYYTLRDRRIGWGQVNPLSEDYRVDFFGSDSFAIGYARMDLDVGRV